MFAVENVKNWRFSTQLTVALAATILFISVVSTIAIVVTQINNIRENTYQRGAQVVNNLAIQSEVALLFHSEEPAQLAAAIALSFPWVIQTTVTDEQYRTILSLGSGNTDYTKLYQETDVKVRQVIETENEWHFLSPVYITSNDVGGAQEIGVGKSYMEFIGFVDVVFTKEYYKNQLFENVVLASMLLLIFIAVLIFVIRLMIKRLTAPLDTLSALMKKAGEGRYETAEITIGSQEISDMSITFNRMIELLKEREKNLDLKNIELIKEVEERKIAQKEQSQLQKQLLQAQKMDAIGQLTGGIAHDFNNILASVLGYTMLAREKASVVNDEKLIKYIDEVKAGGERARDLVKQMLAFTRKRDFKLDDVRSIDIVVVINDTFRMLQSILPSTVVLEMQFSDPTIEVKIDPVQLNQVVMNLCINARDAMNSRGKILIKCDVLQGVENLHCASCHKSFKGNYVRVSVSDNGPGIPDDIREKLFEPFFTTKEVGKGTGMGLAMVHGIAHGHNGHVILESGQQEGASFQIFLPS